MSRRSIHFALAVLMAGATVIYTSQLGHAPAHLMHDEVNFALQAHSIATSARDTNGRLLPLYFSETGFEAGRDPVMIYATALMLKVRPLSESAVRMPAALAGVASIGLMFLAARRLFQSDAMGLVAAGLLALTPAHFINTRLALSITFPIPFILAWLWCLSRFLVTTDRRLGAAIGAVLGVGVYTYVGSLIMMPLYLTATVGILVRERRITALWPVLAGFAAALIPLVLWQLAYPDRYDRLAAAYRVPVAFSGDAIRARLATFWMFFNPDFLFLSGDSRMTNSTRSAGMFPIACAVFIPVGILHLWRRTTRGPLDRILVAGFLVAPLATVVSGHLEINRVMYAIPFGVLVAAGGVTALLSSRSSAIRFSASVLLAGVVLQFGFLYTEYMGAYRVSSAPWFGGDARGAVEDVIAHSPVSAIYLNGRTPIERYWRFYVLAHGQPGLLDRPTYYDADGFEPSMAPDRSLLVCVRTDSVCNELSGLADWRRVSARIEPDASVSFEVFEKGYAAK
jgi:4-amino-4-deoxy-L-arabinose transferase-like glycosyltransferase